ncbi:MAG: hypothetical protein E4H44_06545 [Candidatus Aminicenantes bacterium]|nr:MAG: hypothetical protein E4H44_06545 [Candidatus Aminicenantes bacterium]
MPCSKPIRGADDLIYPPDTSLNDDPCGKPVVSTLDGVDVSTDDLCLFHYALLHGQLALIPPYAFTP